MRKLDTSAVTAAIGLPIKAGTLVHFQAAYAEALTAAINTVIGAGYNTNAVYILYGCQNTGTGLNYIISAGAVYVGGEIYQVAAATFTAPAGQVAVGNLSTGFFTDPTADPVVFTDQVSRNIHQVRILTFAAAVSGTGTADFTAMLKGNSAQVPVNSVINYVPAGGSLGEFDASGKGITYNTFGWAICNGSNGTTDLRGKFLVGYSNIDVNYGLAATGGSKTTTLVLNNIPAHVHTIAVASGTTGTSFAQGAASANPPGVTGDGTAGGLAAFPVPFDTRPPFYSILYIQRIY